MATGPKTTKGFTSVDDFVGCLEKGGCGLVIMVCTLIYNHDQWY
jgi:hypothetical protein